MKTVIEMAREGGMNVVDDQYSLLPFLERFAALVRAYEREACAVHADEYMLEVESVTMNVGDAIRNRSNT